MLIVFDLDGTLANIDHRLHHIKKTPKDWDAFYAAVGDDEPNDVMIRLYRSLSYVPGNEMYIFSGRRIETIHETIKWLYNQGIIYPRLEMRLPGDRRPDVEVKRDMLNNFVAGWGRKPDLVIDDRQSVVDFWRSEGITCLQCKEWKE